jgi:hypothetical protein
LARTFDPKKKGSVMVAKPDPPWTLKNVQKHLQMATLLEAWTIPYYMAVMHSIVDRTAPAYQALQSVLHQEMLHLQLVANVANAYSKSPVLKPGWFTYGPTEDIPYLHVKLGPKAERPSKTSYEEYRPRCAEIGPLDQTRVNTMCVIEYPYWAGGSRPAHRGNLRRYDSIGQFYDALEYGATQVGPGEIRGGRRQVDMFSAFYRRLPRVTVDASGEEGLKQVLMLLRIIRDQGEAAKKDDPIGWAHENTADDRDSTLSHYDKFCQIRAAKFPQTYPDIVGLKDRAHYKKADLEREKILCDNFTLFLESLNKLFAGENPHDFATLMVTIGANIVTCWRHGIVPKFTTEPHLRAFARGPAAAAPDREHFYDL